jgi:hypothetical protein
MPRTSTVFISSLAVCCAHEPAPAGRVAGGRMRSCEWGIGMAAGEQVSVQLLRERQGCERERCKARRARGEQNAGSSTYVEQRVHLRRRADWPSLSLPPAFSWLRGGVSGPPASDVDVALDNMRSSPAAGCKSGSTQNHQTVSRTCMSSLFLFLPRLGEG